MAPGPVFKSYPQSMPDDIGYVQYLFLHKQLKVRRSLLMLSVLLQMWCIDSSNILNFSYFEPVMVQFKLTHSSSFYLFLTSAVDCKGKNGSDLPSVVHYAPLRAWVTKFRFSILWVCQIYGM